MDDPRTVRVTLTYGNTLTEGVGGWSTTVTLTRGLNRAVKGYTSVQREGAGNQASSLIT